MVNMNFYLKFQVYSNLKICWIFCSWKNSSVIATWKITKMLLYSLFPYHLLFSMLIFMDISSVISLLPKMTRCHPHSPKIMQSHISPPLKKKKKVTNSSTHTPILIKLDPGWIDAKPVQVLVSLVTPY